MRDSRTVLAFIFGLVGGLLILVTLTMFVQLFFFSFSGPPFYGLFGFFVGIVSGVFVIVGASMAFLRPAAGVPWGIVMVVFGAMSGFGLAGFGVGMGLSIAGGALAIVVGASPRVGPPSGEGLRACTTCGMLFHAAFPHCPHCGAAVHVPRTNP